VPFLALDCNASHLRMTGSWETLIAPSRPTIARASKCARGVALRRGCRLPPALLRRGAHIVVDTYPRGDQLPLERIAITATVAYFTMTLPPMASMTAPVFVRRASSSDRSRRLNPPPVAIVSSQSSRE
jgi:hypothetical protein